VYVNGKCYQPSLIFANKAKSLPKMGGHERW
jgi:hypothetical protein